MLEFDERLLYNKNNLLLQPWYINKIYCIAVQNPSVSPFHICIFVKKINTTSKTTMPYLKPLIHGQINFIKLVWHIFWIKNCSIKFDVSMIKLVSGKLIKLVLKKWPCFEDRIHFHSLLFLKENIVVNRGVFRTQSNVYDGASSR